MRKSSSIKYTCVIFCALVLVSLSLKARANDEFRDAIRIVGSSTVFPFAAFVAEKYYRKVGGKAPVVESTGSGGGIKMFCGGIGKEFPDFVNASRRMKMSEIRDCVQNKVMRISEVMIGWDGIVIAKAKTAESLDLDHKQLWKALAKRLPIGGKLVANPYKLWSEIDPELPAVAIQVFGPPPTSGTRDVFVDEVMGKGCLASPFIQELDEGTRKTVCGEMREDGVYIEAGEDDDLIVRRLVNNPKALGIMGYNTLERRENLISAASISGVMPTFETIHEGSYPLARPLFIYVKEEHLEALQGMQEFLNEFLSVKAIGEDGYLIEKGLIPLHDDKGSSVKAQIVSLSVQ